VPSPEGAADVSPEEVLVELVPALAVWPAVPLLLELPAPALLCVPPAADVPPDEFDPSPEPSWLEPAEEPLPGDVTPVPLPVLVVRLPDPSSPCSETDVELLPDRLRSSDDWPADDFEPFSESSPEPSSLDWTADEPPVDVCRSSVSPLVVPVLVEDDPLRSWVSPESSPFADAVCTDKPEVAKPPEPVWPAPGALVPVEVTCRDSPPECTLPDFSAAWTSVRSGLSPPPRFVIRVVFIVDKVDGTKRPSSHSKFGRRPATGGLFAPDRRANDLN
jgi:hypothetical protein